METPMFRTLGAIFSAVALLGPAAAQQAPAPPLIRIVVPFSSGGSTDVLARSVAAQLGPRLGTNVIVENRAGAGGLIGASAVAKGPSDGSMLLLTTASLVTSAATTRSVTFDVNTDLIPVALLGEGPMVVAVSSKINIKTPADLVAAARARPDALSYGTAGVGTIGHLTAELLNDSAGIQTRHIPYKGTSLALIDLASGTIDMTVAIYTTLAPQIKSGRVRLIGVTSRQLNPAFPGVLPMASAVPGFEANTWVAVFAPRGTAAALVQRLNRELNEIARSKDVAEQLLSDGATPRPLTPEEVRPRVRESFAVWKKLATAKKIAVE
jgi:tripartite-type tricarboxylate transporter receptor subunit TctC